jgi:hypothetical protein
VLLAVAAWLMLVPVTVVYLVSQDIPAPHQISTRYSWWTWDENLTFVDSATAQGQHLVNGVRLDCGSLFTTGPHESTVLPDGPTACAGVETPRCLFALSLLVLALLAAVASSRVPVTAARYRNQYVQPRAQRRILRRDH